MTTLTVSAILLLSLCAPVFADAGSPGLAAGPVKIRFAVRESEITRSFDVVVAPDGPCASATERRADRSIELKACMVRDSLDIEWSTRRSSNTSTTEYHSTSSVKIVRGETTELGSSEGPRLTVTIQ
jgi:hypothetical protein